MCKLGAATYETKYNFLCRRRQLVLGAGPRDLGEQGVPLPGDLR